MLVGQSQLGAWTSPFKKVGSAVKSAGKVVYKAHAIPTKYAYKGTKVAAKAVYKAHAIPTQWLAIKPTMWLAEKATAPVKKRVQTIVKRRAAKLAWDRRKSKTPTPAEHNEARDWTRKKFLMMSAFVPAAPILVAFAGPSYGGLHDQFGDYQLGVAPAVVAAAVPVLIAAATALISQLNKPGDAPADPTAGGGGAPGSSPAAPPAPGEVDMTPVQEAAEQAQEATEEAVAAATGQRPPGKSMTLPGGMKVQRSHMLLGAAVLGAVVLVMAMKGGGKKSLSGARRRR